MDWSIKVRVAVGTMALCVGCGADGTAPETELTDSSAQALVEAGGPQGDPEIDYVYAFNQPVYYTDARRIYLTRGSAVTFETSAASTGCNPVLHLYKEATSVVTQSFTDDDGAGFPNSRIAITVPETGYYVLVTRALDDSSRGTATIKQNGVTLRANATVSGTMVNLGSTTSWETLNYFTSHSSTYEIDTRIWLTAFNTGNIVAAGDDYVGTGDFDWGSHARLRSNNFGNVGALLLAAFVPYQSPGMPAGTVDVYGKVVDAAVWSWHLTKFPHWKPDEAMRSSRDSNQAFDYNCISWSGGVSSYWAWPPGADNPWYVEGDALQSFHNYYANRCASGGTCARYSGQDVSSYGDYSTDPTDASIALWRNPGQYGEYTHASVTKPGNDQPHGFEWESKLGSYPRFFHQRDALRTNDYKPAYGNIVGYYRKTGVCSDCGPSSLLAARATSAGVTESESIRAGRSVPEANVAFDQAEASKLQRLAGGIPASSRARFTQLMNAWLATLADSELAIKSNPDSYLRSAEFKALEAYVQTSGRLIWPLLLRGFEPRHPVLGHGILTLLLPGREAKLQAAVQEWVKHQTRADGKFQIYSPENARIRFAKSVLSEM